MKQYKNIFISIGIYVLAFVWYFIWVSFASSPSTLAASIAVWGYFTLIVISVIFSFISHKQEESSLINNLVSIFGLLLLIGSFLLYLFYKNWGE